MCAQAYNFRLCVTDNASLRVPFRKPGNYRPSEWEALRRFWLAWPDSTSEHKAAQAKAPSAILGPIPSSSGARKFDAIVDVDERSADVVGRRKGHERRKSRSA